MNADDLEGLLSDPDGPSVALIIDVGGGPQAIRAVHIIDQEKFPIEGIVINKGVISTSDQEGGGIIPPSPRQEIKINDERAQVTGVLHNSPPYLRIEYELLDS